MPPSEDIRRYRGDWLVKALVDDYHGLTPFQRLDGRPLGLPVRAKGRFDAKKQRWDTEAGPSGGHDPPLIAQILIPAEERIAYLGETVWMRRDDFDAIFEHFAKLKIEWAFIEYARDPSYALATYWPSERRMRWGRSIPDRLKPALIRVVYETEAAFPMRKRERSVKYLQ